MVLWLMVFFRCIGKVNCCITNYIVVFVLIFLSSVCCAIDDVGIYELPCFLSMIVLSYIHGRDTTPSPQRLATYFKLLNILLVCHISLLFYHLLQGHGWFICHFSCFSLCLLYRINNSIFFNRIPLTSKGLACLVLE